MDLTTWIYVSKSNMTSAEVADEMEHIVEGARIRNDSLQVTGALLFTGLRFVQLLEGPSASISLLQSSIFRDGRHEDVMTISSHRIDKRAFDKWALAYAGPSRFVTGAVERAIVQSEHEAHESANVLLRLLAQFSPLERQIEGPVSAFAAA